MLRLLMLAVVVAGLTVGQGCARPFRASVKLGLIAPLSGHHVREGYSAYFAAKTAVEEANRQGGLGGHPVELVTVDDSEVGAGALAFDPDVLAVVGYAVNQNALAAADALVQQGMPLVAVNATATAPSAGGRQFSLAPGIAAMADTAAQYAAGQLHAQRIAVLVRDTPAEAPYQGAMAEASRRHGLTVVYSSRVPTDAVRFPETVGALSQLKPEAVLYWGDGVTGADLWADLRRNGIDAPFLAGPSADTPEFFRWIGAVTGEVYVQAPAPDPQYLTGTEEFRRSFGETARADAWGLDAGWQATLAYDAAQVALAAMREALAAGTPDRDRVAAAIPGRASFLGLTGAIRFQADGHRLDPPVSFSRLQPGRYPGDRFLVLRSSS